MASLPTLPSSEKDIFKIVAVLKQLVDRENSSLDGGGSAFAMTNGVLTPSVAANALTIAVKTLAGADPSIGDPVDVFFRSATLATGDYTRVRITSATSLVVSSGSKIGTVDNVAFRLWIVGFNDGGTFRLGVINCYVGGIAPPLAEWALASSTAEGGAGGADSSGVFYTGTAVSSKAFRILGFMSWESGLATAGTWSGGPTVNQPFGPGVPKPGEPVQSASVTSTDNSNTTNDTLTASTITVGITPKSACNPVVVFYRSNLKVNANNVFAYSAITRGGTLIGTEAVSYGESSDIAVACSDMVSDFPMSTSSTTWTLSFRNFDNATSINIGSFTQTGPGTSISATEIMA